MGQNWNVPTMLHSRTPSGARMGKDHDLEAQIFHRTRHDARADE